MNTLRASVAVFAGLTLVTGVLYPFAVLAFAQGLVPRAANGSPILFHGNTVGSALVGQHFERPDRFWGRPSATSGRPYDPRASGGSNLGPSNPALAVVVRERGSRLGPTVPVPIDLVTASASGLDPHISPAGAHYQVPRVARARGLGEERLHALVERHVESRDLGFLGMPRVNVLRLNLALDQER